MVSNCFQKMGTITGDPFMHRQSNLHAFGTFFLHFLVSDTNNIQFKCFEHIFCFTQINLRPKRYRLSTALCRLHRGSQINPQINAQLRGETRSAISQQYCRCQTASTTAQNSKRVCCARSLCSTRALSTMGIGIF